VRVFGLETEFSFAPLAYLTVHDIFAYLYENGLPVHPVYAMTGGGRWDKYRLRVSAIGNPEGRGVGRLVWEKEYYGDVLARMGTTLWHREYDV
jgi:phosphoadenosine phosphosulfate reductase